MSTGYNINGSNFEQVYVRRDFFLDGNLWMWGRNNYGQVGNNTSGTNYSSPVQTAAGGVNWYSVDGGIGHTAGIKSDGTLWTWGKNDFGQLGTNNITQLTSPAQTVSAGTNWRQVSATFRHTAAIKTDGTLWVWGRNHQGQIGINNTSTNYSSPVQTISGGSNWKQVSTGYVMTMAIKNDGTLWTWGYNGYGELGLGNTTGRSSPSQVGGTTWQTVSAGNGFGAGIKTDGTLWTWGRNESGQLGDNSITNKSSPVQTVAAGTNWKQVTARRTMTAAIKTDGTLWVWGQNYNGELGTNNKIWYSSPVQTVAGGTNWKSVVPGSIDTSVVASASNPYVVAVKTDGTLWAWGNNTYGQLSDGTTVSKSSPIQVQAGTTNWKMPIASGGASGGIRFPPT